MIVMGVAIEQDLDVCKAKAELLDVLLNLRDRFIEAAVEQDVTVRSGDQIRTNFRGTDVVHVADDSIWFNWLVPGSGLFGWLAIGRNTVKQKAQKAEHEVS